jgi:uncharacterized protein YbjT (DUF2867 family)
MILMTGATGNVGRPLIESLHAEGARVRAVSRTAGAGLPAGAEAVQGDPSRPATIAAALRGVTSVFINPAAVGDGTGELLALARDHRVRRVVLLSALAVDDDAAEQPNAIAAHHKTIEDAVTASGLEWAILRPGAFATNTLTQWSGQIRAGDVVRGPYAGATSAPIHERDLAEVAARALLTDDLLGARPSLTGPDSLTQAKMVETIGGAIGRPLRYTEIPREAALGHMVERGFPEPIANTMLTL